LVPSIPDITTKQAYFNQLNSQPNIKILPAKQVYHSEDMSENAGYKTKKLIKLIGDPKKFSGYAKDEQSLTTEAHTWLQRMTRLKDTAKLDDNEILFVAGEHLVEKAQLWWTVTERKVNKWDEFITAFNKQYLADKEDSYWTMLQELKQGNNDSVDDVALKMEELFVLLNLNNNTFQVRTFLGAIKPAIAFEVERENSPKTLDIAKERAKAVEKNFVKYHVGYKNNSSALPVPVNHMNGSNSSVASDGWKTAASNMESIADRLERMQINFVEATKKQNYNGYRFNRDGQPPQDRIVCYKCGEPGHKSYQCTKDSKETPVTGSNTVPVQSGKEKGQF
jgi:hypothetical protein